MLAVLHIDWLALQLEGFCSGNHPWRFEKLPYSTRQFRELYEVYYYDDLWATIQTQSTLPTIPGNFCILKVQNKYLYDTALWNQITMFMIDCNFKYHGISRVDVCIDFQKFDNGDHPEKLIRDFGGGKIDCLNKMGGQIIRGADSAEPYEYLALGSRRSDVRVYLYNKSKELREVKSKPWILECDYEAGLSKDEDIWRLEVSLKGQAMNWTYAYTGELLDLTLDDLRNDCYLQILAYSLFDKYFAFIKHSTSKNKYKNARIPYITTKYYKLRRVYSRDMEDANRADRIFIKKAMKEAQTSLELHPDERWQVITWLYSWADARGLADYLLRLKDLPTL